MAANALHTCSVHREGGGGAEGYRFIAMLLSVDSFCQMTTGAKLQRERAAWMGHR